MAEHYDAVTADPPLEDSADLTDEQVAAAIKVATPGDLAAELRKSGGTVLVHDFRRRGEDVYWRTTVETDGLPKILVFYPSWLNPKGR